MKNWLSAALILTLCGAGLTMTPAAVSAEPEEYTPLVAQYTATPRLAKLSDGTYCLNYELIFSNAIKTKITIESIRIVDPATNDSEIYRLSKEKILSSIYIPGAPQPRLSLAPAEGGFIRIDLSFSSERQVPKKLGHIITVSVDKPYGNILPGYVERIAETAVVSEPVVIGPPLKGDKWIALAVGKDTYHRGAIMPINGKWFAPERWAVDWIQMNDENKLCTGELTKNENYPQFGKEVLAVKSGTIETVRDGLPDIAPGKFPEKMTIQEAAGNYIILELGDGNYALYAHIKRGSIKVKPGQKVRKGEVIGLLGNSGNTTAPHLHFHVIRGKLPLGSDGIPYVLESFIVKGTAVSQDALETELESGTSLEITRKNTGKHIQKMPHDLAIVEF